jgi:hypothetical protein
MADFLLYVKDHGDERNLDLETVDSGKWTEGPTLVFSEFIKCSLTIPNNFAEHWGMKNTVPS